MTILNKTSSGYISTMVALWRTARTFGAMDRDRLLALCSPRVKPGDSHMGVTLSTWRGLGMFEGPNDALKLVQPFDAIATADTEALRTAVLDVILREGNCPALLTADLAEEDDASRASDFVRVACWTLAQDPYWLSSLKEREVEAAASNQGLVLYQGAGRWVAFKEWVYFAGLGIPTLHGLVLCPARAIREEIRRSEPLRKDRDVPLAPFLDTVAHALPVLDGGRYRKQIDELLRERGRSHSVHQVSPTLTLALLQLEHEGEIVLSDRPGDVAVRLSLLGRGQRIVKAASHIRRGQPRFARSGAVSMEVCS